MRIGRVVRQLRRRLRWRQIDLARRAVVSQQAISLIETGRGDRLSFRTLSRVLQMVGAELDVNVRWRGGSIEQLIDEAHGLLTAAVARHLGHMGWIVHVEVTYEVGRATGSIDLLAFHPERDSLVVVEVKSEVLSAEATLRRHDEKRRLGKSVAAARFGWTPATVSSLLVLPDSRTARRRVDRLGALFGRTYPVRGWALVRWLADPEASIDGMWFVPITKTVGGRQAMTSRRRVAVARSRRDHD